jgi:hypothetical protein
MMGVRVYLINLCKIGLRHNNSTLKVATGTNNSNRIHK